MLESGASSGYAGKAIFLRCELGIQCVVAVFLLREACKVDVFVVLTDERYLDDDGLITGVRLV